MSAQSTTATCEIHDGYCYTCQQWTDQPGALIDIYGGPGAWQVIEVDTGHILGTFRELVEADAFLDSVQS